MHALLSDQVESRRKHSKLFNQAEPVVYMNSEYKVSKSSTLCRLRFAQAFLGWESASPAAPNDEI